jgi:hypothetical protein
MTEDPELNAYLATVRRLQNLASSELADARGDASAIRRALCRFFKRGYASGLTTGELVDFFGVSGTVVEDAGYSEATTLEIMEVIGTLSDEEIDAVET